MWIDIYVQVSLCMFLHIHISECKTLMEFQIQDETMLKIKYFLKTNWRRELLLCLEKHPIQEMFQSTKAKNGR